MGRDEKESVSNDDRRRQISGEAVAAMDDGYEVTNDESSPADEKVVSGALGYELTGMGDNSQLGKADSSVAGDACEPGDGYSFVTNEDDSSSDGYV